ncbi:MAG: hypothetical protein Hens3KO_13130 [Henriciella sp.]
MSFLSRLFGTKTKQADTVATPDISRIIKSVPAKQKAPLVEQQAVTPVETEIVDFHVWMKADIQALCHSWDMLQLTPEDKSANEQFRRALHNLYGASGAYGGGALTRLCGSLEELLAAAKDIAKEAALINLLVQACHSITLGNEASQEEVANAICDSLEARVKSRKA